MRKRGSAAEWWVREAAGPRPYDDDALLVGGMALPLVLLQTVWWLSLLASPVAVACVWVFIRRRQRHVAVADGVLLLVRTFTSVQMPLASLRTVRFEPRGRDEMTVDLEPYEGRTVTLELREEDGNDLEGIMRRDHPQVQLGAPRRRENVAAAPRSSGDPVRDLREIRRAEVGRWWLRVRPHADGSWRAEAHTVSGPAGVWAGQTRPTLAEATADAVAIMDELRAT